MGPPGREPIFGLFMAYIVLVWAGFRSVLAISIWCREFSSLVFRNGCADEEF